MKRIFFIVIALGALSFLLASCEREKGCTGENALNRDYTAEVNDGSCVYSNVTFYASASVFNGIPVTRIDVAINGDNIGAIQTAYPNAPGNCSAPCWRKHERSGACASPPILGV